MARVPSKVYFPWEQKHTWLGQLGRARLRTFLLVFAALAVLVLLRKREEHAAAERATRAAISTGIHAVEFYRADHAGACPKSWRDVALAQGRDVPTDAWGAPLRLVCPGRKDAKSFEVLSDGPDGLPYGLDRIE
jgi:hypothetical protein